MSDGTSSSSQPAPEAQLLAPEIMERIRQEEIFRLGVRSEIEEANERRHERRGIWAFLNSAFGIWFLSTIVIGAIGWLYAENHRTVAEHSARDLNNEQLRLEVAYRMEHYSAGVWGIDSLKTTPALWDWGSWMREQPWVFAEYRGKRLSELIWALSKNDYDHRRAELNLAFQQASQLEMLASTEPAPPSMLDNPAVQERLAMTRESFAKLDSILGPRFREYR